MQRKGMKRHQQKYTWRFVMTSSSIQRQKSNRKAKLKTTLHLLECDIHRQSLQLCSWLGTTVLSASVECRLTRAAETSLANSWYSRFFGFSTTMTCPAHQLYCSECLSAARVPEYATWKTSQVQMNPWTFVVTKAMADIAWCLLPGLTHACFHGSEKKLWGKAWVLGYYCSL